MDIKFKYIRNMKRGQSLRNRLIEQRFLLPRGHKLGWF